MRGDEDVSTADARIAFLNDEPIGGHDVRQSILASWARSREFQVAPDRIDLGPGRDGYRRSPLLDLALPVVEGVTDLMATEPVSVILCDDDGTVLERRTGDTALHHHLDKVWLAPGFSYAERVVGTNGIGTALESRAPARVFGPEHWAEGLEDLACAAVPVRHPATGRIVGVLNLTCWRRDANAMLMTTATLIAQRVEQGLRDHVGRHEAAVLADFLQAARRTRSPVLAVSGDVVMLDDAARERLDPLDHERLVAAATEAFAGGHDVQVAVQLASGEMVQLDCRTTWSEPGTGGGVAVVRTVPAARPAADVPTRPTTRPTGRHPVQPPVGAAPGPPRPLDRAAPATPAGSVSVAVGGGTLWSVCRRTVDRHRAAGDWLVLSGEAGSGRRTLARAAARAHAPGGRLRVMEAGTAGDALLEEVRAELLHRNGTLVLADVDAVPGPQVRALMDALEPHRWSTAPDRPWVLVTVGAGRPEREVARLVERFPATVVVPPLRHHAEDVPELVRHVLDRLGHHRLALSPQATSQLARCRWPGNVTQLERVLADVVARRRSGTAQLEDLPAEVFVGIRRTLTPVESLECDAIIAALRQCRGSKTKAAALLGLSRATVYRKVREYGIADGGQRAGVDPG